MQLYGTSPTRDRVNACREYFDLLPAELATLVALAAYERVTGAPMPLEELACFGRKPEGDELGGDPAKSVGSLYRKGLAERIGGPNDRAYAITPRGRARLRQ